MLIMHCEIRTNVYIMYGTKEPNTCTGIKNKTPILILDSRCKLTPSPTQTEMKPNLESLIASGDSHFRIALHLNGNF